MNLFRYGQVSLLRKYLFLLTDGGKSGRHVQLMDNNRRINSRHVFIALGKDILVLSQKCSERLLY